MMSYNVFQVQHLEENGAAMADDLMQKSLIIQAYVMDSKAGKEKAIFIHVFFNFIESLFLIVYSRLV